MDATPFYHGAPTDIGNDLVTDNAALSFDPNAVFSFDPDAVPDATFDVPFGYSQVTWNRGHSQVCDQEISPEILAQFDQNVAVILQAEVAKDQPTFAPTVPEPDNGPAVPYVVEVRDSAEDVHVGFLEDVVGEEGFPTVEDTRRTIAEALSNVKGYGESKEKFMPVASFVAKMKRCLETHPRSWPDFSPQLKHWTITKFHLNVNDGLVYRNESNENGRSVPEHPVPVREDCHKHLIKAHKAANHGGRDQTQKALNAAGVGKFISKDFITKWIQCCPTCSTKNKSYAPRKKGTAVAKGPKNGIRKVNTQPRTKKTAKVPPPTQRPLRQAEVQPTASSPQLPVTLPLPVALPQYNEESYFSETDPWIATFGTGEFDMAGPSLESLGLEHPSIGGSSIGGSGMEDPILGDLMANPNMQGPNMLDPSIDSFDMDISPEQLALWQQMVEGEDALLEFGNYGDEIPL